MLKKQTYEKNQREQNKEMGRLQREARDAKKAEEEKQKAKEEAQKKVNEEYERYARGDYESGQYSKKGSDIKDSSTTVNSGKKTVAGLLSGPVANSSSTEVDVYRGRETANAILDKYGNVIYLLPMKDS